MTEPDVAPARIGDVARAFVGSAGRRELAAMLLGAVLGALLSVLVGLGLGLSPFREAWGSWPLPWLTLSDAFLVIAVIGAWQVSSIALLEPRLRAALEAHTWVGERALGAWHRATGSGWWTLPPTTPRTAVRWLERHPADATNAYARIEVLLLAERFVEAARAMDALVPRTDAERIAHADLRATMRLLADGALDLEELRSATDAAAGDDRLEGRCALAVMETRAAIQAHGDWLAPLAAARQELGARANGVLWRRFLPRRLLVIAPMAALALLGFGLLRLFAAG